MPKKNFGSYGNLTNLFTELGNKFKAKVGWAESERSVKKNLFVYTADRIYSTRGVTITYNDDGTVTINGTVDTNNDANIDLDLDFSYLEDGKSYILSGCPSGGGNNIYRIVMNQYYDGANHFYKDDGNGVEFVQHSNCDWTKSYIRIIVFKTIVANNLIFKPMIRLASIADDTYETFIYDNVELKEQIDTKASQTDLLAEAKVRALFGVGNLLNYDAWTKRVAVERGTAVFENNGVTLTATGADCYTNYGGTYNWLVPVKESQTYILSWDTTEPESSQKGKVIIFPYNDAGTIVGNNVQEWVGIKKVSYTVASGVTKLGFRFGVASSGDTLSYKNIKITLVEDANTEYVGYTQTNEQLYNSIFNESRSRSILGAKNFCLPCKNNITSNGVTLTTDSIGATLVNGTATANGGRLNLTSEYFILPAGTYFLNTEISDPNITPNLLTANIQKRSDSSVLRNSIDWHLPFTVEQDTEVFLGLNVVKGTVYNTTIKVLVRLNTDLDDKYQPYAKTNKQLTNDKLEESANNVLGAKNLLPNLLKSGTYNGITFTHNEDGSVTCEGTATADMWVGVYVPSANGSGTNSGDCFIPKLGAYTFSGCPQGGGDGTYTLNWVGRNDADTGNNFAWTDNGTGVTKTFTDSAILLRKMRVYITIKNGTDLTTPITFYPMIRFASYTDDTYVPYAMTNKQLTDAINELNSALTASY